MNCENVFELISASLDGELTEAEEAQLREHLAQCPACRALQEELAGLRENTQAALDAAAPAELKTAVLENLPAQKKPAGKVIYWKRWGAMAAAVALVALAAWQLPRFVFDPVDISPAAGESAAEVTADESADLPEEPAVTFSYATDAADSADVDTIPDAGATYGAHAAKMEPTSAPVAPSPASGSGAAVPNAQSEDELEPSPVLRDLSKAQSADAPDEDAPADSPEPQPASRAAFTGGTDNSADGGTDGAVSESRMAKLDADPTPACWRGVLTLAEYEPAADYPVECSEDGQRQYTLPAADFLALVEALDADGVAYDLRTEGDDVSPDAPSGLVIVPSQPE